MQNSAASRKVIYYSDELNDDFAGTNIKSCRVGEDYVFVPQNIIWRFGAFVLYRLIATPLVWLYAKLFFGLRIENRKAVRQIKKQGFFLFGNHTQTALDAFTPTLISFPRRAHIVVNPDAVSIKGLRAVVAMLGGIPLPTELKSMRSFQEALGVRFSQGRCVTIYPEAHIWKFYTGIRPFPPTSFSYPVKLDAPCIAFVTTYRQRKIFKKLPPLATIVVSDPFYPDRELPEKQARQKLRDEVYDFMRRTAARPDNYSYIEYRKK